MFRDMVLSKVSEKKGATIDAQSGAAKNVNTVRQALMKLHCDDSGEHSIEFLMLLTFGVLPMIGAVFLLRDVLKEYVAFGQIFITSPFF